MQRVHTIQWHYYNLNLKAKSTLFGGGIRLVSLLHSLKNYNDMQKLIISIKWISHKPINTYYIYYLGVVIAQFRLGFLSFLPSSSNRTKSVLQCCFPHMVYPSHINGSNLVVSPTLQTVDNATSMACMHNSPLHWILQNKICSNC